MTIKKGPAGREVEAMLVPVAKAMTLKNSPYLDRPLRTEREAQRDIQRNCDHAPDELCVRCDSGIGIDQRNMVAGKTYQIHIFKNYVYPEDYKL